MVEWPRASSLHWWHGTLVSRSFWVNEATLLNFIQNYCINYIFWDLPPGTRDVFICRAGQTRNESERATLNCAMSRSENLGRQGKAFRDALFSHMKVECLDFIKRRQKATFAMDMNTGTSISGTINRGCGSHANLAALSSQHTEEDEEDNWVSKIST